MAHYGINEAATHKSRWLPASVLPVRPGFYEVGHDVSTAPGNRAFMRLTGRVRYFNGKFWSTGPDSGCNTIFGQHVSHQWRGLTKKAYDRAVKRMRTAEFVTAINNSF